MQLIRQIQLCLNATIKCISTNHNVQKKGVSSKSKTENTSIWLKQFVGNDMCEVKMEWKINSIHTQKALLNCSAHV